MLIQKTTPAGVDIVIQKFQTRIHTYLADKWGLGDDYRCYGRCYRNATSDGYIAENYESSNEYKEVYWDDSLSAISFFGLSDGFETELAQTTVPVHLVFFVNLADAKPSITHRADEEVRRDVVNAIGSGMFGFTLDSIDLWLENVLQEYRGSRRDNRLHMVDMHPVHCFRLNFSLRYNINNC